MKKIIMIALAATCSVAGFSRSWGRDAGRGIDILSYCRKTYGDSAETTFIRTDARSWRCTLGKRAFPVDLNAACRIQYDASYYARMENPADAFSWNCYSGTALPR